MGPQSDRLLGTTIKLYLPRAVESIQRADPSAKTEIPLGQGETVLVVEDQPEVRTLTDEVLGSLGYQVLTADTTERNA